MRAERAEETLSLPEKNPRTSADNGGEGALRPALHERTSVERDALGDSGEHPIADGVSTRGGARADVAREVIYVRDGAGRLLFEHDAETGKSVLYAPAGDLELRADHGNVVLSARDAVRVRGEREVEVATPSLVTTAIRATVTVDDVRLVARTVHGAVEDARHVFGRLTIEARRIVERSKDVYRDVEGVEQVRAGRMRHIVSSAFQLLAERAGITTEQDLKLNASKIHLG